MAYILPSDVRKVMRKLPTSFSDAEVQFHIDKASAYLDSLLGGVFVVPFEVSTLPPLIKHIVIDLTVFFISEDLYSSQQPNMDEYQRKRFDRVMQMISDIISGVLVIGIPPKNTASGAGFSSTNEEDPIFTLEDPFW